ncbi:FadR/GntR family transcriptional regulator [Alteromonas gracilis]|jgi:GntR family transcriptional repressor for pyruvate dehydrogenase complex|uniref:GntR family transcriptional regulator n=1 Tax=Alteromonas gracilis TaxID=1479524 RepID=A0ABX5CIU6_9ALTE|nr:FadR/GntR family transcriptional regulator [Alteromonas gracilis]PRO67492.1 GntR family transcriptional regulator [Alteromonas gracilis]
MQHISPKNLHSGSSSTGQRLYLQVADSLAQLIINDNLSPGDRLSPERELAQEYEVSRQTVREALIALEVSGLVEIRPGSGVYVLKRESLKTSLVMEDAPGPLEIMEARTLFEGEAAALAAQRISNEELLKLKAYLKQMEDMVALGKIKEAEEFDGKFHRTIAQATRNSAIITTVEWLWSLRESSEISRVFNDKIRQKGSNPNIEAHKQILESLSRYDSDAAKKAMQSHLADVSEAYILFITD